MNHRGADGRAESTVQQWLSACALQAHAARDALKAVQESQCSSGSARVLCRAHTARLPPDLLWLEWFQGRAQETWETVRGHPLYVYHKNLLDHIGTHSSFAIRPDRLPFPQCFDSMASVWSIHPKERFNVSSLPA